MKLYDMSLLEHVNLIDLYIYHIFEIYFVMVEKLAWKIVECKF